MTTATRRTFSDKTASAAAGQVAPQMGARLVRHATRRAFANANSFAGTFAGHRRRHALPAARIQHFFITLFAVGLGAPFALVGANLTFLFGSISTGLTGAVIGFAAGAFLGLTIGKIVIQTIRISPAVMYHLGKLLSTTSSKAQRKAAYCISE